MFIVHSLAAVSDGVAICVCVCVCVRGVWMWMVTRRSTAFAFECITWKPIYGAKQHTHIDIIINFQLGTQQEDQCWDRYVTTAKKWRIAQNDNVTRTWMQRWQDSILLLCRWNRYGSQVAFSWPIPVCRASRWPKWCKSTADFTNNLTERFIIITAFTFKRHYRSAWDTEYVLRSRPLKRIIVHIFVSGRNR